MKRNIVVCRTSLKGKYRIHRLVGNFQHVVVKIYHPRTECKWVVGELAIFLVLAALELCKGRGRTDNLKCAILL